MASRFSSGSQDLEMQAARQPAGQPRQDGPHGDLEMGGPLSAFFSKGLPVNVFMLLPVIWKMVYYHQEEASILSWFSGVSVVCLVASFLVHLGPIFLTCECIQKLSVRCKLAYLSVLLRIVAATLLLLFLDPVHHLVAIIPLSVLVLGLLAYFLRSNLKDPAGKYWGAHEAELKLLFDLSSQVVSFAFAGLLGTVFGYVKVKQQQGSGGRGGHMSPADCFLSYSIVSGLLVQLLCTVPTFIFRQDIRKRMAKVYLRIVAYASLMFLVLGGVMAAEEILREWVFIVCFIIVFVIPVLCFWCENIEEAWREESDDKASQLILAYFTQSFAALMASNSKYSTGRGGIAVSLSGWFKFSVLSVLHGVLSYAVRMVLFSEMPQVTSTAFPKKVWTWSMLATVPITCLLVTCVGFRHPDELKNIFS